MSIFTPAAAPKVLVVYFSRTGYTRRTAQMLAKATGGELCAITENRSRLTTVRLKVEQNQLLSVV